MRMGSKFTRLVLAFTCCAITVSGAKGPGSGNGNGGQDDNGNSGRNGGNASATQSGGGGNRGGNHGGGGIGATTAVTGNTGGGGQGGGGGHKVGSLKTVAVPGPSASELNNLIRDKAATIALGKAFFWEMQFGSDGATACATCHFNAGGDSRTMNQTDPGLRRVDNNGNPSPDSTIFHPGFGANHLLSSSDFPLHLLSDPSRSNSPVLSDNNNIVGSQGVYRNNFNDVVLGLGQEDETAVADPVFGTTDPSGAPINVRRSTPRNAPSVINAVFNYRNFWDGRAQNTFNGVNPFGAGDPAASLLQTDASSLDIVHDVTLRLSNSALASQAVGPPGSDVEMSATGRPFVKMGKKMLAVTPLVLQNVSPNDSVLGSLSAAPFTGLNTDYVSMIQAAFQPKWWNSDVVVDKDSHFLHLGRPFNTDEYSQMEYNFSMFWGVAIQMYESTLVSNNSRFDQFMDGNRSALTAQEQRGLDRFQGKGGCTNCHNGAELTDASISSISARGVVERLPDGRWHDVGFHNIGVRPVNDDLGIAASDPSGLASLSAAQLASMGQFNGTLIPAGASVSVRGAVKTPSLRNVELTAPFFLNGGQATLEQVVDFYSRGGDFPSADVDPNLERAGFSADDKAAVVAFLKSLTDERVRSQSAPFDHPSLIVPNGMMTVDGVFSEQMITIPATGAAGGAPLQKFCAGLAGAPLSGCN
ncbi:MAG TPA: cytochrome c peroxidase [Candidatus Angelobacter sp.]|nr:cytochrome c peroxidase [Candidatus Angelobacter sp.]